MPASIRAWRRATRVRPDRLTGGLGADAETRDRSSVTLTGGDPEGREGALIARIGRDLRRRVSLSRKGRGTWRINRLRSAFRASSATLSRTASLSKATVWPERSEALTEVSSSTLSITVTRRRAPMFSTAPLAATAASARASTASGVKVRVTSSVACRAWFWRIRLASGSVRMRTKSSRVRAFSATRIGRRPCSSVSRLRA